MESTSQKILRGKRKGVFLHGIKCVILKKVAVAV